MTASNIRYLARQRESALAFSPPPDFPGAGGPGEKDFNGQVDWKSVPLAGQLAMGMGSKPWAIKDTMTKGEMSVIRSANEHIFS
jgi:hypothetical protein